MLRGTSRSDTASSQRSRPRTEQEIRLGCCRLNGNLIGVKGAARTWDGLQDGKPCNGTLKEVPAHSSVRV